MVTHKANKNIVNDAIIKEIVESIRGLKDGVVTVTVSNSKIVQIEVSQKIRYDHVWTVQDTGSGI